MVLLKIVSILLASLLTHENELYLVDASFVIPHCKSPHINPSPFSTSSVSNNNKHNSNNSILNNCNGKDNICFKKKLHKGSSIISFFMANNDNNELSNVDTSSNSNSNALDNDSNISNESNVNKNEKNTQRRSINISQREPTTDDLMRAMGTSPRRIFVSLCSSIGIALTGDLFGITSAVLNVLPEDAVESTSLDTYYPRGDLKRYKSDEYKYTFVYPKEWVADQAVFLLKQQQIVKRLDYTMSSSSISSSSSSSQLIPDAAFGPPGKLNSKGVSQSDTNVSIIVSTSTQQGLSLSKILGPSPEIAANTLLDNSIAPPGSGRTATLISAIEENRNNVPLYQFEYIIDKGTKKLQSISVITVRGSDLITLTVVSPMNDWENGDYAKNLRKIANSFKLLSK